MKKASITPTEYVPFVRIQDRFLGTSWCFAETADGEAYWVNTKTKTVVPSERNRK